ncbi:MAG: hypothetical protein RLY85_436 [Bacteroidota bacterium]|jgi:hypothetical protein
MKKFYLLLATAATSTLGFSQGRTGDPKLTEMWQPVPAIVKPGPTAQDAPSDAIVLFNGKDFSSWNGQNGKAVEWTIADGAMTVKPGSGTITSKQGFGDCQLHIEWRTPSVVKGEGQGRGNSGIFLMGKYELQVLDSYENKTYSNGQAASIYKQLIPLANASRKPGEWQTYDVIFIAPRFSADGRLQSQARITVIHNGVLVQNNAALWGGSEYIGIPEYKPHSMKEPIILQDHGDLVSFRNIWIREL